MSQFSDSGIALLLYFYHNSYSHFCCFYTTHSDKMLQRFSFEDRICCFSATLFHSLLFFRNNCINYAYTAIHQKAIIYCAIVVQNCPSCCCYFLRANAGSARARVVIRGYPPYSPAILAVLIADCCTRKSYCNTST